MAKDGTHFIGTSAAIREVEVEMDYAARSDAKVLITGESGVGKEIAARLIHQRSRRSQKPIVPINCAGIPDSLLESELFGHVRGSFTDAYRDRLGLLEVANDGTVFLDEVGEMSLRMQALLLRFLESGEIQRVGSNRTESRVDVRIIAATNRNLIERVASHDFREDLFYRLNVIHIAIPPLRERREDIPVLLQHFFQAYAERQGVSAPELEPAALDMLMAYDWPGNIRELKNLTERMTMRAQSGVVARTALPPEINGTPRRQPRSNETAAEAPRVVDTLFDRMALARESFWSSVYPMFMARDLTRNDIRKIVAKGLQQTGGSYKLVAQLFNLPPGDYKRFLNFLRRHGCDIPHEHFRVARHREVEMGRAAAAAGSVSAPLSAAFGRLRLPHVSNKRRAERYAVHIPLRYRRPGEGDWQEARTENISRIGVLFRTAHPVNVDSPIEILLKPPPEVGDYSTTVLCRGQVVRTETRDQDDWLAVAATLGRYIPVHSQENDARRI